MIARPDPGFVVGDPGFVAAHRAAGEAAHPAGRSQAPPEILLPLLWRADDSEAAANSAGSGRTPTTHGFAHGLSHVSLCATKTDALYRATDTLGLKMARFAALTAKMA